MEKKDIIPESTMNDYFRDCYTKSWRFRQLCLAPRKSTADCTPGTSPTAWERGIAMISIRDAEEYLDSLDRSASGSVSAHVYKFLRPMMYQAAEDGFIARNQFVGRGMQPKHVQSETDWLDPSDLAKLLEAADNDKPYVRLIVYLLVFTGMRRGKVCGMRWGGGGRTWTWRGTVFMLSQRVQAQEGGDSPDRCEIEEFPQMHPDHARAA